MSIKSVSQVWYQIVPDKFAFSTKRLISDQIWSCPPTSTLKHGGSLFGIAEKVRRGYFDWIANECNSWGIYLTPIYQSYPSYHKYWPESHTLVDEGLGGFEGLIDLIGALKEVGGNLMLDLVFNHTGITHPFFLDVLRHGPKSDYLQFYRGIPDLDTTKVIIPILDPYRSAEDQCKVDSSLNLVVHERYIFAGLGHNAHFLDGSVGGDFFTLVDSSRKPNYDCWWGLPDLPELATSNPSVKRYLFNSAALYTDLGISSFRLDVPDYLDEADEFWTEFREFISSHILSKNTATDLYLAGEIWDHTSYKRWIRCNSTSPQPFDSVMNYPVRRAILNFLGNVLISNQYGHECQQGYWNATQVRRFLCDVWGAFPFEVINRQLCLLGSHDVSRVSSLLLDPNTIRTAFSLLFLFPGCPTIYYGDEICALGKASSSASDLVRSTMKWSLSGEVLHEGNDMRPLISKLLRIRNCRDEFSQGNFEWVGDDDDILAFRRSVSHSSSIVIAPSPRVSACRILEWISSISMISTYQVTLASQVLKLQDLALPELQSILDELGLVVAGTHA
jgi:glycosidase